MFFPHIREAPVLLCSIPSYTQFGPTVNQDVLSATWGVHTSLSFLDPQCSSSFAILQHIQAEIPRVQAHKGSPLRCVILPITSTIFDKLRDQWEKGRTQRGYPPGALFISFFLLEELLPTADSQTALRSCIQ